MPYPNEHAARVREPSSFVKDSIRSKILENGVRIIVGKLINGDSMVPQAYRFPVDKFTLKEAEQWLEDNKISYIKLEPASEKELAHVGVLGMKWGVRKGPPSPGGRQDRGWEKKVQSTKTYMKVYNKSADRINNELPAFNSKYRNVNLNNKANRTKYLNAYKKKFEGILNDELAKEIKVTNPSGTKRVKAIIDEAGGWMRLALEDVEHADKDFISNALFKLYFDSNNFITQVKFMNNDLEESNDLSNSSLSHVGVLGMRWGVRKGRIARTTTMLTKKRQAILDQKELSSLENKKGPRTPKQKALDEKKIAILKDRLNADKDYANTRALLKKEIRNMSNEELRTVANRLELEARYKNVKPNTIKDGEKVVKDAVAIVGTITATAAAISSLVALGKKIMTYAQKANQVAGP